MFCFPVPCRSIEDSSFNLSGTTLPLLFRVGEGDYLGLLLFKSAMLLRPLPSFRFPVGFGVNY